jgi:hypothetical protein
MSRTTMIRSPRARLSQQLPVQKRPSRKLLRRLKPILLINSASLRPERFLLPLFLAKVPRIFADESSKRPFLQRFALGIFGRRPTVRWRTCVQILDTVTILFIPPAVSNK